MNPTFDPRTPDTAARPHSAGADPTTRDELELRLYALLARACELTADTPVPLSKVTAVMLAFNGIAETVQPRYLLAGDELAAVPLTLPVVVVRARAALRQLANEVGTLEEAVRFADADALLARVAADLHVTGGTP